MTGCGPPTRPFSKELFNSVHNLRREPTRMSACSKYRCKRYPSGLGTLKPKSWLPNLSYDSRASPPNEANIPPAKCTYLTMSHGSLWRFGSLRNCQFSSYVGSGYLRAGSGVVVWAVAGEAARTADATSTKLQAAR